MSTKISLVKEVNLSEETTSYYLLLFKNDVLFDKVQCSTLESAKQGYENWVKFANDTKSNDYVNNLEISTLQSTIIE